MSCNRVLCAPLLRSALNAIAPSSPVPVPATAPVDVFPRRSPQRSVITVEDRKNLDFLPFTTINLALDTYYEYNFNDPVGRVNLLRAYDVLSNEIQPQSSEPRLRTRTRRCRWTPLGRPARSAIRASHRYLAGQSCERTAAGNLSQHFLVPTAPYVAHVGKGLTVDFRQVGKFHRH